MPKLAGKPSGDAEEPGKPAPTKKTTTTKAKPNEMPPEPEVDPTAYRVFEPVLEGLDVLDDMEDYLRVVYYGEPGVGKTSAALTLAKTGRVVVIDAERGLKPKALASLGIPTKNVQVWRDISYRGLETLFYQIKAQLEDDPGSIVGVVWDSITQTVPWLIEAIGAEGMEKAQMLGRDRGEFDVYTEDYGTLAEQLKRLIVRRYFDLPCHVVITAHPRRDQDEEGGVLLTPGATPAVRDAIVGNADMVIHVRNHLDKETGEMQRRGVTRPQGKFTAKERFGILPGVMVEPSMERILGYFEGDMTRDTDEVQLRAAGEA